MKVKDENKKNENLLDFQSANSFVKCSSKQFHIYLIIIILFIK
jgi:hypothetical protein